MEFEWDERKRRSNLRKHQLDFVDAVRVFTDSALITLDSRKEYGEDRYILYGTLTGRVVVIAFVYRGIRVRIISMRKATSREQKFYVRNQLGKI